MTSSFTAAPARVLPPWEPVRVERSESGTAVGVWGRCYRFDAAALPTSIVTAGREVLAAPVRLTGLVDGQPIEWQHGGTIVHDQAAHAALLVGHQCSERLILNTAARIEYDGLMRLDLTLVPEGGPGDVVRLGLESLALEIPLRPEAAALFHYWPQWFSGTGPDVSAENSGSVPEAGLALPFKPFVWLGWEEGGLGWFAESDRGWQPPDGDRAVEIVPDGAAVVLRLNLLGGGPPVWAGQEGTWRHQFMPLTFRMGLQATPVKPIPRDFHQWRIAHYADHHAVDEARNPGCLARMAEAGVRTAVIHEAAVPIQNSGFTDEPDELRRIVDACHERGVHVLMYFGYELSTLSPRWADEADEVLVKGPDGVPAGGWRRKPDQREFICCYRSRQQDVLVAEIVGFLDRSGIDGLYLDQTSVPFGCANEAHGCGHVVDGSRRLTFPIFAVRNLMKRLYEAVESRGGIISVHQSSGCVTPTLAFAHSYYDGEHLIWDEKYVTDPRGTIGLDTFRAEFTGTNFGIPSEYCCLNAEAWALPLVHGVRPRPADRVPPSVSRLWDAMDGFGVGEAEWWPYWRNETVLSAEPDDVRVSAWIRRDPETGAADVLLVAANLSPSARADAEIVLRFVEDGAGGGRVVARDAIADIPISSDGRRFCFPLDPLETRLVRLQIGRQVGRHE